jgi:hypothetical protein
MSETVSVPPPSTSQPSAVPPPVSTSSPPPTAPASTVGVVTVVMTVQGSTLTSQSTVSGPATPSVQPNSLGVHTIDGRSLVFGTAMVGFAAVIMIIAI